MRYFKQILIISIIFSLNSCHKIDSNLSLVLSDLSELSQAITNAKPGTVLTMANGIWKDAKISFYGIGTENKPITLRAETPGKVFLEGQSYLHLGGKHLKVSGLHFRNGYSPRNGIIRFQIGSDSTAFNTQVTDCVIEDFSQLNRWENDQWIEFYGKNNQLDHCYISGKSNDGATLMVYHKGNQHTNNHHQIVYNYFGPRPRKGGPRAETMRLGGSETSMTPGYVNVSNNYFEACNGEVEIISDKTNYNSFTNNIFYKCEGSLVMRHGNYTTVDANIFIGDDDSDFYGGIRAVNTGHWITNNYFYKIRGEEFRSPLAIMNGIPKSPLNRYKQVTDVVVAHNTWVDCKSPWQIGVGQNKASADVLPISEIRSAPPIRTVIANNLIYNTRADQTPVVNHDNMDGILFKNNIIDNKGQQNANDGDVFQNEGIQMQNINPWLFAPKSGQEELLDSVYMGFGFDKIEKGLFGSSRTKNSSVGAINNLAAAEKYEINKSDYGPTWYSAGKKLSTPSILSASSDSGKLQDAISKAKAGDIIELTEEKYTINASLNIDKEVTIRSKKGSLVKLSFTGTSEDPAFKMYPKGKLSLENISVIGQKHKTAFAPLNKNMSSAYIIYVDECIIQNFGYVLKATKGSFADSISFNNTSIQNCDNGFVLAADEKGDYNAEFVNFENCQFNNIGQNVINYYRGGYDESTIGGFLTLVNNTFLDCGKNEKSGLLIKTPGIINVFISGNTFKNNPVKLVALLWGIKNNHHNNNTVINSGEIRVEEQQKLEILY